MKTLKKVLPIIIFMMISSITYSYTVDVIYPSRCPSYFSYIFNTGSLNCKFIISTGQPFDSDTVLYKIYIEQNGNELELAEGFCLAGEVVNRSVNLQNFTHFCFNEKAIIRVDAKRFDNEGVLYNGRGYFVDYIEGLSCKYLSKSNNQVELMTPELIPVTFFSTCGSPASGTYFIKRYKITCTITGDFRDSVPVLEKSLCLGYSGAGPNNSNYWAAVLDSSMTQYKFITFTYFQYNILGQLIGPVPCRPEEATFTYRYIQRPRIQSLTFYPQAPTPLNKIGYVYCNLQQGNGNLQYRWKDSVVSNIPVFFQPLGNKLKFVVGYPGSNPLTQNNSFFVFSSVSNEGDSTPWKKIQIDILGDSASCPNISFNIEGDNIIENAILNGSPSHPGVQISDYMLFEYPEISKDEQIKFRLFESGKDITELNYLGMTQINVNPDELVAVTGDGEIINYKTDSAKTKAIKNDKDDVSSELDYDDDKSIDFKKGEKITLTIPDIIGYNNLLVKIYHPVNKDIKVGTITFEDGSTKDLFSRDNMSSICFKIAGNPFSELKIEFNQDVFINQIKAVKNLGTFIAYQSYITSAISLKNQDIRDIIQSVDAKNFILKKDNDVNFNFERGKLPVNKKAYFILNTVGEITKDKNQSFRKSDIETTDLNKIRLYENSPNPFNPITKIKFDLSSDGFVKLGVFDISGREIKTIVNEFKKAGTYDVTFDGSGFASGVYFYRLETVNGFRDTKRMILVK